MSRINGRLSIMDTDATLGGAARTEPVSVPDKERPKVARLRDALRKRGRRVEVRGPKGESLAVPDTVTQLLRRVVEILAAGHSVTLVPTSQVLTTQQAAALLNVSRQYLVRLLDEGRLPCTRTGTHRRLRVDDVLRYKAQRDRERETGLRELTQLHEDLGGYGD
jgi:excisionase family DNA binding protein